MTKYYWNMVVCINFGALVHYSVPAYTAQEACDYFYRVYGNGRVTKITQGSEVVEYA